MITSSDKLKARYKAGDSVSVKIIEILDARSWLVSLSGTLIQVKNATNLSFNEGETVQMKVISLNPPQLSIL